MLIFYGLCKTPLSLSKRATATPKTFAYKFEGDVNQDMSIQGNTLNCASSTTSIDTPYGVGTSIYLNATNGASCLKSNNIKNAPNGDLTVSFWVKPGTTSSHLVRTGRFYVGYWTDNNTNINDDLIQFSVGDYPASNLAYIKKLQDDQWHHLAATYNGATMKIYVDGTLAKTKDYVVADDVFIYGTEIIQLGYTPAVTDILMDDVYLWPLSYDE